MADSQTRPAHKQARQAARRCGRAGPGGAPAGVTPSLAAARARRLAQWVRWLLGGLAVPLLRAHFYATESEAFRNTVLYYRSASISPNHNPNPELPPSLPASTVSKFSLLKSCNRLASVPTKVSRARDEVATGRVWRPALCYTRFPGSWPTHGRAGSLCGRGWRPARTTRCGRPCSCR